MKNAPIVAIEFVKMNTLSHFDFLFCLPSRLIESEVAGTKGKPPAVTAETPTAKNQYKTP